MESALSEDALIPARGVRPRRRWSPDRHPVLLRLLSATVLLASWEIYGRRVDPLLFTYPTAVAAAGWDLVTSGELLRQMPLSLASLGAGLGAAVALGVAAGLVIGRSRMLEAILDPHINALAATPPVALTPLLMLWLGLGFGVKVAIVFLFAFFPVLINTGSGAKQATASMLDLARVAGASKRQVLVKIVLPAALPLIMVGIRLAAGRALVGMIVGELFTALTGLGALLTLYGNTFETARMFAVVIVLAALGAGLAQSAQALETRLIRWKGTERAVR